MGEFSKDFSEQIYDSFNNQFCCSVCEESVNWEDINQLGQILVCNHCFSEYTFTCEYCDKPEWNDKGGWYNDNHICKECSDNGYRDCNHCGNPIRLSEQYFLICSPEKPYCLDCYLKMETLSSVKNPSFKPSPKFFDNGLFFGVELEIDNGGKCNENAERLLCAGNALSDHIYVKVDESLKNGLEIVSHPMSLDYHTSKMPWKSVMNEAQRMGYSTDAPSDCGLHVHVGRNELGNSITEQEDAIGKMLFFIENNWDYVFILSQRTEEQLNRWSARYGCSGSPVNMLEFALKSNRGKHTCLNLENSSTVEFRLFRSTLNYSILLAYLQFVHELAHAAMEIERTAFERFQWHDFTRRIQPTNICLINLLKSKNLMQPLSDA